MHTKKPKVLHVIARFNVGGTARYLGYLLPQISADIETLLAVGNVQGFDIEDSSLQNIKFIRIKSLGRRIRPLADIRSYFELRQVIKNYKPDVIHSHTFKAGLLSRLMYFKIPKVHTFHGHLMNDPEFSRRALQVIINIERRLAKLTTKLITVGEQVSKDLLNVSVGKSSQYISIASEGDNLKFVSRENARKQLGIDQSDRVILWMARMEPVKNPMLAIEVAKLLPNINFLMAGGGKLLVEAKSQAPANVTFLGWVNPNEIIPAADIFLSTSANEGVPYSLIEAQSFGLPIVSTDSGAVGQVVKNHVNGLLTSNEAVEIVRSLKQLLDTPGLIDSMKMAALESASTSKKMPSLVPEHLKIYKMVTSR